MTKKEHKKERANFIKWKERKNHIRIWRGGGNYCRIKREWRRMIKSKRDWIRRRERRRNDGKNGWRKRSKLCLLFTFRIVVKEEDVPLLVLHSSKTLESKDSFSLPFYHKPLSVCVCVSFCAGWATLTYDSNKWCWF